MNRMIPLVLAAGSLVAAPVFASHDGLGGDYAKVISADPVVKRVRVSEPRRVCHEEPVTERTVYRSGGDPLFGALVGGVIGHQFGGGRGKDVATVAGALMGASHASGHRRVVERTVYETHCNVVREARYEERIEGYNVAYRYHGRVYHTWLPYDPGRRLKVRVDVAPARTRY